MVDAGIMSNQSNSKDMRMLQADIDSMKLQNDSVGRGYYKEAMAGTYKAVSYTHLLSAGYCPVRTCIS